MFDIYVRAAQTFRTGVLLPGVAQAFRTFVRRSPPAQPFDTYVPH